jgi:putative hydrolase of the HAD superfamily
MPLALFDLDNTLVDRQAAYRRWARQFVRREGLPDGAEEYLCQLDDDGFADRGAVFGAVRQRYGLEAPTEDLIAAYRVAYPGFFEPDPAVNEALGRLRHGGWRIGVITNGPPSQRHKMERAGLLELIDGWCISDEEGVAKPDRRIFDEAVLRCRAPGESVPGTVWMVGDAAETDVVGGVGAGFRTIWMHRKRTWNRTDLHPDEVAASIPDAVGHILAAEAGQTS